MLSRFSSIDKWRWYGPAHPEAGSKWFSSKRSKIATARSCSISGLRRTTVCSSRVMPAIRQGLLGSPICAGSTLAAGAEPDRQRQGMRIEAFRPGETDRGRAERRKARRIAADERAALEKIEDTQSGCVPRAPSRRQDMVGSGDVVANRFRRMAAEKDRSGMADPLGHRVRLVDRELQVFGGNPVDQRRRLFPIVDEENGAMRLPAGAGDRRSRQPRQVAFDRRSVV